jgi:hypothetical protein
LSRREVLSLIQNLKGTESNIAKIVFRKTIARCPARTLVSSSGGRRSVVVVQPCIVLPSLGVDPSFGVVPSIAAAPSFVIVPFVPSFITRAMAVVVGATTKAFYKASNGSRNNTPVASTRTAISRRRSRLGLGRVGRSSLVIVVEVALR